MCVQCETIFPSSSKLVVARYLTRGNICYLILNMSGLRSVGGIIHSWTTNGR